MPWQRRGADGWQVVQIHRGPQGWDSPSLPAGWERLLVQVMECTGHPVLAAVVFDSDGAQLIGYSPQAGRWGGWLMLDRIIRHIDSTAWPRAHEDEHGRMQAEEGEDYQRRLRRVQDPSLRRRRPARAPRGPAGRPLGERGRIRAGCGRGRGCLGRRG